MYPLSLSNIKCILIVSQLGLLKSLTIEDNIVIPKSLIDLNNLTKNQITSLCYKCTIYTRLPHCTLFIKFGVVHILPCTFIKCTVTSYMHFFN